MFLFFFFNVLAAPSGMQDLSSPTKDRTHAPLQRKCRFLTTEPPVKSLKYMFLKHPLVTGTMVAASKTRFGPCHHGT